MADEHKTDGAQFQGGAVDVSSLLRMAASACDGGNPVMGVHLYLAAFGFASKETNVANEDAIRGLKRAWSVACGLKERALAEYIYEKMEPFLSADEEQHCAMQLQELAFERLSQYGISKEALEDVSRMIDGELGDLGNAQLLHVGKIPRIPGKGSVTATLDVPMGEDGQPDFLAGLLGAQMQDDQGDEEREDYLEAGIDAEMLQAARNIGVPEEIIRECAQDMARRMAQAADEADLMDALEDSVAPDFSRFDDVPEGACIEVEPDDEMPEHTQPEVGQRYVPPAKKSYAPADGNSAEKDMAAKHDQEAEDFARAFAQVKARMVPQAATDEVSRAAERISYLDIAGYQRAIDAMASMGIGVEHDQDFQALVAVLNEKHGLDRMPAADTLVFRAPACEDASRFIQATVGQLGLPSLRMSMDENAQGMPVLCVMADASNPPKMNAARNAFQGPAVLVIESLDAWIPPQLEQGEGLEGIIQSQMGRGAREAINLIHSAVESPDVYVLCSISSYGEVDPFFCELLAPFTVIEIDNPNEAERFDVWASLVNEHPSLAYIDADEVVRYSANMSRADMYLAVREAIEESYKASLAQRKYEPVRPENILEKLSAYQPLESAEYKQLEENVVGLLRDELDGTVDDLLGL